MGERAPPCKACGQAHGLHEAPSPQWIGLDQNVWIIRDQLAFGKDCRKAAVRRIAFELRRRRERALALGSEVRRLRAELRAARAVRSPTRRRRLADK